jgi:hypothetical protein
MQVRTDGRSKNGSIMEITLDENDAREFISGWEEMSLADRWKALSNKADTMLVEYMYRRGEITPEFAKQRMQEIAG